MKSYEFRVVSLASPDFVDQLNQLGLEGFHIACAALPRSVAADGLVLLQREKP
ncbi:MAG: hypothetical protein JO033_27165 [Acidobacteriaceae bacterium]|nr:hypothetical protein [Acidobacteriaceae bacterium]